MKPPEEIARLPLPTPVGEFELRGFQGTSGHVHLALVKGEIDDGEPILTRLHSECLTGDALASLRCDCGMQLRVAMRRIAAEGRGVLVYAGGHEGRGIGLADKLRAYVLQDLGEDTLDGNRRLGFPVDGRDYREVALVLRATGVRRVRLMTNNPDKMRALTDHGIVVEERVPLPVAPHARNARYLAAKQERMQHLEPGGEAPWPAVEPFAGAVDVRGLLGDVRPPADRPYTVLKYAQTLDGRIATRDGEARWISGREERRLSHALRAACDAVLVGAGTVLRDDPRLTVRLVAGATPLRVVLDSRLRAPPDAHVFDDAAATIVLTSPLAPEDRRRELRRRDVRVETVSAGQEGLDLPAALGRLRSLGVRSLLVEGGARVITSVLRERVADRAVIGIAPLLMGTGTDAVGDLSVHRVPEALRLEAPSTHVVGGDVVVTGGLAPGWDGAVHR